MKVLIMNKKFHSLQEGIKSCIKDLDEKEVAEATQLHAGVKKNRSHFYKCAEGKKHDIHHKYSVALDIKCVEKGMAPSMLRAHEAMINQYFESTDNTSNQEITFYLGQIMEEVGQLTTTVVKGLEDETLSQAEQKDIRVAIKKAEEAILKLKTKIGVKVD